MADMTLQQALDALAAMYAQQGGNPSAMPGVPQLPQPTPLMSQSGNIHTAGGLAGQAALPAGYRPDVAFPVAPYMPILDGVVDPITGQSRLTPQQVLANAAAVPPHSVIKAEGRPPPRVQSTAWSDPSIPKLLPLNADLTQVAQAQPAPPNGFGYQSGYVKSNNERLLPGQPLAFVPQSPMPPAVKAIDVAAGPPMPRPRPNVFPTLNAPMVPSAGPKAGQPKQSTYAGMTQPPSMFPHADEGMLSQMSGLAQMAKSPLGGFLMMLGGLGGSSQTPRGPMLAMNGQPSNFPNPISGAPGANVGTSGAQSFDGSHFMSGNTPGAYYDPNSGWVVPGMPNVSSSGSALA